MRLEAFDAQVRARRLFTVLLVLLAALVARTGYLQLVRGPDLAEQAERQHFRRVTVPAPRGRILDRHRRPLAASYHARSVAADPQIVGDLEQFATRVAFLLGEPGPAREFAERIAARKAEGKRFVYLRRRVDRDTAERVRCAHLPGLDLREEPRREYPHGDAAAALLGAIGSDEHGRLAGLTGLEKRFDHHLRGKDGFCSVFRSGRREMLHLFPERARPPRPGKDLVTTIDVVLQQVVEDALDTLMERHRPGTACAIALEPRTGEILAIAGRPGLDPTAFPQVSKEALRIPAAQCSYEPGSTIKPLIMAWALSRGAVRESQFIDCGQGFRFFGGRRLRDVKPYGRLPLQDVLVKSSNIGMAQVGQALGVEEARAYLHGLGFGKPTGVEVTWEQTGKITPAAKWHKNYTLVSVSMGHELMVTPLQLAAAYGALVNGGDLHRPTLVRHGRRAAPRRVAYTPDALAFVHRGMERVVEEGTGRRARIAGVRVGGKTGTSEKYPEGSGKYVSSFVGFAPVDDPRLLVLVVTDEPRAFDGLKPYGGVVAAPVVKEILRRGLPLIERTTSSLPGSGVRQKQDSDQRQGKVRVAAVHRSSVWVGETGSPAESSRNPDSVGEDNRKTPPGRRRK